MLKAFHLRKIIASSTSILLINSFSAEVVVSRLQKNYQSLSNNSADGNRFNFLCHVSIANVNTVLERAIPFFLHVRLLRVALNKRQVIVIGRSE